MKIEPLTCAIGAQISGVSLADAARDNELYEEMKAALLKHKVLFLRDQNISDEEHAAFARHFGDSVVTILHLFWRLRAAHPQQTRNS